MDTLPFVLTAVCCSIILIAPLVGIGIWTRYKSSLKEVEKYKRFSDNLSERTLDVKKIKRFFIVVIASLIPILFLIALSVLVFFNQTTITSLGENTIWIMMIVYGFFGLFLVMVFFLAFIWIMYKK